MDIFSFIDLNVFLDAGLVFCSFFQLFAVLTAICENTSNPSSHRKASKVLTLFNVYAGPCLLAILVDQNAIVVIIYAAISASVLWTIITWLDRFSLVGHLLLTATIQMVLIGILWGGNFLLHLPLPMAAFVLLGIGALITLPMLPLGLGKIWLLAALLGRRQWCRPRTPLNDLQPDYLPKISIHVPCYAEPPEVVIRVLNALKNLDYPKYEVILIDNNTKDPGLWMPLQAHCQKLGPSFRFIHVDRLPGAKAGALNYILPMTSKDAEIIAIIDSDYVAGPDFLRRLVGFFKDDRIGFIQTSHDYRLWENRLYQKTCYWEYMPTYKQLLPTLNEWSAAYTVGTMCLIRRQALEEAGGWAEWCLTEDSEVAIRIHALGYKSLAIADTFGRGLIPETYADYKKQRFRWTAGPAQQFKKHYRLLLSNFFSKKSPMSTQQKFFELVHCTEGFQFVMSMAFWLLTPILLLLLVTYGNPLYLPRVFWIAAVPLALSGTLLRWLEYRMLGATLKETLLAQIASMSLLHTREVASITGFFSRKPLKWKRTNKFKALPSGLSALKSSTWEVLRGLVSLGFAGIAAMHISSTEPSFLMLGTISLALAGFSYFTSPLMAVLGERDLFERRTEQPKPVVLTAESLPLHGGKSAIGFENFAATSTVTVTERRYN